MPLMASEGKILKPLGFDKHPADDGGPKIIQRGFHSLSSTRNLLKLERDKPWMLPKASGNMAVTPDTIRIIAMRFDFQYENPDDASTTGRGWFDLRDTLTFFTAEGHMVDPSPHVGRYFDKHLEALSYYYSVVSEGKLVLVWDVYPKVGDSLVGDIVVRDSVYHLPHTMGYYGSQRPDSGLSEFTNDAIKLVDTTEPAIHFADYDSYILIHAGSDRQNDIGYPLTASDLYTGNIFLGEPIIVDKSAGDSTIVWDAMIIPETASQDNRATALNAVMAHEFGHQLGLIDLYNTSNFFTQVGDFSLMDNNGFGTAVDFGYSVGRVFGALPVFPDAWSRAYLGFVEPVVYRQGSSIQLVAAEMTSNDTKIAKIPISEYEYYLLENRSINITGRETYILGDKTTSVMMGPYDNVDKVLTTEYDLLLPGSGILIWHVDERVAMMDFDDDGISNFSENQLQVYPRRRFVELMEADGLVDFGGDYYSGFGKPTDMYYEGNNSSFTPNTNPPSIGYNGVNSHIYITNISPIDLTMTFDLEYDFYSAGFPRRVGYPIYGLSPVAADLDNDGYPEIIAASGRDLLVMKQDGSDFLPLGSVYLDTVYFMSGRTIDTLPLFARTGDTIVAGPVTGYYGQGTDSPYVAIATPYYIYIYSTKDDNEDGLADFLCPAIWTNLRVLTIMGDDGKLRAVIGNNAQLLLVDIIGGTIHVSSPQIKEKSLYGMAAIADKIALLAGDSDEVKLYYVSSASQMDTFDLEGPFFYGPAAVDLNRDGMPEVISATPGGIVKAVTIDTTVTDASFQILGQIWLSDSILANPALADIDDDGHADMIAGSNNKIFAFDRNFISLSDFPLTIDRGSPDNQVLAAPVVSDINGDGHQDIAVITSNGNCYAFGTELLYGFPISAGGIGYGSPLVYRKSNGGGFGLTGRDGWFYSYDVGYDSLRADWPMGGGGPFGTYYLPESRLGSTTVYSDNLPRDKFFCYPNPTLDGQTTIRYFLGKAANVTLTMYDLSGKQVDQIKKYSQGGTVEYDWNGSALPTGVYRCLIEADFSGETLNGFTDIAIIK